MNTKPTPQKKPTQHNKHIECRCCVQSSHFGLQKECPVDFDGDISGGYEGTGEGAWSIGGEGLF